MTPITYNIDAYGNETFNSSHMSSKAMEKPAGLPFPAEIFGIIGEHMGADVKALRLTCKDINHATLPALGKWISKVKKVYPTQMSMVTWLALVASQVAPFIKRITVVGQTLRKHPYGASWAWETAQFKNDHYWTDTDYALITKIVDSHEKVAVHTEHFVNSGAYRIDLTSVLVSLPELLIVTKQSKLGVGQHIPGWDGVHMLHQISGFSKELDLNSALYGDWKYDLVHGYVTITEDDFGDEVASVVNPGPQVSFQDDWEAALEFSGLMTKIIESKVLLIEVEN